MKNIIKPNQETIKIINKNNHTLPFVISIPHSGILLTNKLVSNLEKNVILANSDWYLDKLYSFLEEQGFTVIINKINRYVIDVNRDLKKLKDDNSFLHNAIYKETTYGKKIYKKTLTKEEENFRINNYYLPYHKIIKESLEEKQKYFKKVYLIDLHSFATPIPYDVILGNDNFKSASYEFSEAVKELFQNNGFTVDYNNHFKGGYLTRHYKNENCEALQIELSYLKYIEEREFYEEEFPQIQQELFLKAQETLKKIFENLKNI